MEELRTAAREALQQPQSLPDFLPVVRDLPGSLQLLWDEVSSHNTANYPEACEDLLVVQGYLCNWDSGDLSEDDENVLNQLFDWASGIALPSSVYVADLEELSDDQKITVASNRLRLPLAVSTLVSLSTILPVWKAANTAGIVTALASFTSAEDPWTSSESLAKSAQVLKTFTEAPPDTYWYVIERILKDRIKPLFAKTKNPAITAAGRKNFHPVPLPRFDASTLDPETKPWKNHDVYTTTVFAWIISQYTAANRTEIEAHFPLLVPPLLALLDDETIPSKTRGCSLLAHLLTPIRESNSDILARTNLSSVFRDAVKPCLLSLPSITPEDESITLLSRAYPALLSLFQTSFQHHHQSPEKTPYIDALSSLLRDNLIPSFHHISTTNPSTVSSFASFPHPRLSAFLLSQIAVVVTDLKIHTVKYLQDLVPLLHSTLSNPFGPDNPPLLLAGIAASRAVVLNAHPRLWRWRAELLSGVCSCWIYILEEENERTERKGRGVDAAGMLERVKSELKGAVYLLREAIRNPTVLGDEDPGVKDAKENIELEVDGLIRANECLRDLFAGIDPNDGKYFGIV